MKRDSKDFKILYELNVNSRQPINAIAKKVRLSKDSALYRIKRMEQGGIILRYQAYINHGKLGYDNARLNIKLHNTTPEKEKEIIEFIKQQPRVGFFVSSEGSMDFIIWIAVKSALEIQDFWNTIHQKYVNYIAKTELGIYSSIFHYPRAFFIGNKKNTEVMLFTTIDKEEKIDNQDLEILKILTKNARQSIVAIAQKLGISTKTVSAKIKQLEDRKIITGYTVLLDMEKLGYLYYKIYLDLKDTTPKILKQLDYFILSHPNIVYRDNVIGGHTCEIEVQVKTEQQLRVLINDIKKQFSPIIKSHEVLHYYKEHKLLSMPWTD